MKFGVMCFFLCARPIELKRWALNILYFALLRCSSAERSYWGQTVRDRPIVSMGDYYETIFFELNAILIFDLGWPWKKTLKVKNFGPPYISEMKRYRLENFWKGGEWASKRNAVQNVGILGKQDGDRAIIWKSRKRRKLGPRPNEKISTWNLVRSWEMGQITQRNAKMRNIANIWAWG